MPSKILIRAEDDEIRESLKLILADQYGLIMTGDCAQGLDCLTRAKDVGLILWEISASDKAGLKMFQTLVGKFPKVPAIAIVPQQSTRSASKILNIEGTVGCIKKPLKADEILALIEKKIQ